MGIGRIGKRGVRRAMALAASMLLLAACNGLTVDQRGVYTSSPTQTVTGNVTVGVDEELVSVEVNGVTATVDGERYTAEVPLDGAAVFNPVVVEATYASGQVIRERRTVVYGDGDTASILDEGAELPDTVGLRINERSFPKLGPVVENLTTIDTAAIAPPGTVMLDECITRVIACVIYATATTASAPTLDDFTVGLDSHAGSTQAVVTLSGLHIAVDVDARVFGIPSSCGLEIDADSVTIDGRYTLAPDPADPTRLDVNLVGAAPTVTPRGVSHDFVGGICSIPVIEQIVSAVLPDVQTLMTENLTSLLGDPDGAGATDSPVADAIEGALANVHIAGPIGESLGLDLASNISSTTQDTAGIGIRASATFSAASVVPGAPDLTGSVGWGDTLGAIGSTTPGGQPFDVAVGASATGFNQLLAAETERGLLNVDITELDGAPLTLRSLFDLIGAGGLVPNDLPMVVELRPEVAPVVSTGPGPAGALGELRMSGYRATVRTNDAARGVFIELVVDFRTGVSLVLAPDGLRFGLDAPAADDFSATLTQNPLGLPPELIEQVFLELSPDVFGAVQEALPSFPLPQFVGLGLQPVEVARLGTGFVLYGDLVAGG